MDAHVRTGSDYGVTVTARNVPEGVALLGTSLTLWGVPSSPEHTAQRACQGDDPPVFGGPTCGTNTAQRPFLRLPTSCTAAGAGLLLNATLDSWVDPGAFVTTRTFTHELPGYPAAPADWGAPAGTTNCEAVPFTPGFTGTPDTRQAASPSGFQFDLTLPQSDDLSLPAESDLRTAVVSLPAGVRISPSSAQGLAACSPSQIRLNDASSPNCPLASKVGSATITTPLLAQPLTGSVYLATPNDNPFGTLISLYVVAEGSGVVVKVAGRVQADPVTGQLTTVFDNIPQTPFSDLKLVFDGGPRAPLALPNTCGTYLTHTDLTGWNGTRVSADTPFTVDSGCSAPRFAPSFTAETTHPIAGATSTFNVALSRSDSDQELGGLTVNMPPGLTAKLANAVLCSNADAANGTCPSGTKIGDVTVGAGAGPNPFYITNGRAYITGPYKGAPFGLSIVVPAVAGPFNLGNVVVRTAIFIDKHDASVRVVSDPLPTILQGIPLQVRDVRVSADKPDFFLNPTSCAKKTIGGTVQSTAGANANVSSSFQVGECASLGFAPKMAIAVGGKGHTRLGQPTPLTTRVTMPKGDANLRFVRVTLPNTIDARLTVINDACTRAQFESDIAKCAHAKAGTAVAVTPLLRDPLRGNVYFVKNGHPIPDLFVALRGQVAFDLIGRVSIPGRDASGDDVRRCTGCADQIVHAASGRRQSERVDRCRDEPLLGLRAESRRRRWTTSARTARSARSIQRSSCMGARSRRPRRPAAGASRKFDGGQWVGARAGAPTHTRQQLVTGYSPAGHSRTCSLQGFCRYEHERDQPPAGQPAAPALSFHRQPALQARRPARRRPARVRDARRRRSTTSPSGAGWTSSRSPTTTRSTAASSSPTGRRASSPRS